VPPHSPAAASAASAAEREGSYFDALVEAAGDFNPFTDHGWDTLARRFDAVIPGKDFRVLDVGCGTGRSRRIYQEKASRYAGLDLSLGALRLARRRFPDAPWLQADALRLPFRAASHDGVAFSSVLHHVPDRRAALAEAFRVLRPGGWAFAFDPNLLHPAMLLFRHPRSPLYNPKGVSPDEQPLLPRVLRDDFRSAGFTSIGQRCQSDLPYRAVAPKGMDALLPLYNRADWLWEKVGLGRWFGTFVVTWGRKP
jgi:ubiquinone/menaquinone biosynthesis C-methylase UbiE